MVRDPNGKPALIQFCLIEILKEEELCPPTFLRPGVGEDPPNQGDACAEYHLVLQEFE